MLNGVTTYYVGNYYEYVNSSTTKKYYYAGGQRVAMRDSNTVYFLLGDHLGSTSLTANSNGGKVAELRYHPWGGTRYTDGTTPTARRYTGQIEDATIGLYFYNARYYDGALGRFIQADSIIPGAASGSGGGAATLGYDSNTRLTPLTVNLGEFAAQVNAENREVLQFGAFFQWSSKMRQEHNVPLGPANPQALNRYSYGLNNPLRYVDPTGHSFLALCVFSGAVGALFSTGASVVAQIAQGSGTFGERVGNIDVGEVAIAAGVGFAAGFLTPIVATTTAGAMVLGASANVLQYHLTQTSNGEETTPAGYGLSAFVGLVSGGIAGKFGTPTMKTGAGQTWSTSQASAITTLDSINLNFISMENVGRAATSAMVDNWDWLRGKQNEVR